MEDHATLPHALADDLSRYGLIGESAPMHRLFEMIGKVSQSNAPRYGPDGPRVQALPISSEDPKVQEFLICVRHKCRCLVNLRESEERRNGPGDLPRDCPKCGHFLSRFCPFCRRPLDVNWQGDVPRCKQCGDELSAENI
jgi:hypothetical protein